MGMMAEFVLGQACLESYTLFFFFVYSKTLQEHTLKVLIICMWAWFGYVPGWLLWKEST